MMVPAKTKKSMKLLICAQAVDKNDPFLGFFHRWIEEFAKHCERIEVICLKEGEHALPKNVSVHSLGKSGDGKLEVGSWKKLWWRVMYVTRFWRLIWRPRHNYDAVFVHMNPEYALLGGLFWRMTGKRVGLWYVHRAVSLRLRAAVLLARVVFTASRESFRLSSSKVRIMGHGIDVEAFACPARSASGVLRLVTVGRISKTKNTMLFLDVLQKLQERGIKAALTIVGAPATAVDAVYAQELTRRAQEHSELGVRLAGLKPHAEVLPLLCESDIFLNASSTGSLDKAVLEAMAAGVVPVTSNEAFRPMLPPELCPEATADGFADAIMQAIRVPPMMLREKVRSEHSLATLIPRIVADLEHS